MNDLREKLLNELSDKITRRKMWERVDFMTSQILIWLAIVVSFITALVAILRVAPWVTATLAGLSGSLITINENFKICPLVVK